MRILSGCAGTPIFLRLSQPCNPWLEKNRFLLLFCLAFQPFIFICSVHSYTSPTIHGEQVSAAGAGYVIVPTLLIGTPHSPPSRLQRYPNVPLRRPYYGGRPSRFPVSWRVSA